MNDHENDTEQGAPAPATAPKATAETPVPDADKTANAKAKRPKSLAGKAARGFGKAFGETAREMEDAYGPAGADHGNGTELVASFLLLFLKIPFIANNLPALACRIKTGVDKIPLRFFPKRVQKAIEMTFAKRTGASSLIMGIGWVMNFVWFSLFGVIITGICFAIALAEKSVGWMLLPVAMMAFYFIGSILFALLMLGGIRLLPFDREKKDDVLNVVGSAISLVLMLFIVGLFVCGGIVVATNAD